MKLLSHDSEIRAAVRRLGLLIGIPLVLSTIILEQPVLSGIESDMQQWALMIAKRW